MCNVLKGLKFCSCGEVDIHAMDNYWILRKPDLSVMIFGEALAHYKYGKRKIVGSESYKKASKEYEQSREELIRFVEELLLENLNTNTQLFDFLYEPETGDQLNLRLVIDKELELIGWFHFKCGFTGEWEVYKNRHSTSSWNHTTVSKGTVEIPGLNSI
jgi:hypothetical protein